MASRDHRHNERQRRWQQSMHSAKGMRVPHVVEFVVVASEQSVAYYALQGTNLYYQEHNMTCGRLILVRMESQATTTSAPLLLLSSGNQGEHSGILELQVGPTSKMNLKHTTNHNVLSDTDRHAQTSPPQTAINTHWMTVKKFECTHLAHDSCGCSTLMPQRYGNNSCSAHCMNKSR